MVVVTTDYITGKQLQTITMVKGSIVQTKNMGRDIMAGFKTLVGGEIKSYTDMIEEARSIATDRMVKNAQELGADAIVNVRFSSSSVMQGAAEILVVGTAVKFI